MFVSSVISQKVNVGDIRLIMVCADMVCAIPSTSRALVHASIGIASEYFADNMYEAVS